MSELDDLVAVYGRIDDAVQHDPDLLPKVAAMLPPYRYGAAGWYRPFREWQQEGNGPDLFDHRDVGTALHNLQNPDESAPGTPVPDDYAGWATRHWLNARRMLASATLGRIQGNVDLPSDAEPHALVNGIAADSTNGGQQRLHDHLRTAAAYPNMEAWPDMMESARSQPQPLVAAPYMNSTYVPPIASDPGSFRVVHSPSGPGIALRTHYHALDLGLADTKRCLDPTTWSDYKPPWCHMDPVGPRTADGVQQYREVISADCTRGGELTTLLNFRSWGLPDGGMILEYRLPENSNQHVSIDEGSLEIRPARPDTGGIHFVTTKRVQFSALRNMPTMPTAALGFLVWVLGWDTLAQRFLYFLAQGKPPRLVATDQTAAPPPDRGSPRIGPAALAWRLFSISGSAGGRAMSETASAR